MVGLERITAQFLAADLALPMLLTAAAAYLCGCFNGAVIVSKYILRNDIRNHGSGNAGLTNFYRVFGGGLTFAVIFTDVLKAVAAVWVGLLVVRHWGGGLLAQEPMMIPYAKYWTGLFCLLGHMFPFVFRFRGGKGILSGGALALMIDWRVALVAWGGFLILAILTRWVSLGSIWGGISFPTVSWFIYRDAVATTLAVAIGCLVMWKHRDNLRRILNGTESKFSFHPKRDKEAHRS